MNYADEFKKVLSDALYKVLYDYWDNYLKQHPEATMANTPVGEWLEFITAEHKKYQDALQQRK